MNTFRYSIKTMGCKANIYDSLLLEREMMELGGIRDEAAPDVFVLNSCTVTAESDKQAHREAQQAVKKNPGAMTIVTGCYAEVAPQALAANNAVHHVVPNHAKSRLRNLVAERFGMELGPTASELSNEVYWGQLPGFAGKTRAFLKIQEGCNDFCTYCIIPFARGKSRSVVLAAVLSEAERLSQSGVQEIVLTGTNIADWGKESGKCLEDLIEQMLAHTSISRVRLTSLDPGEITDRLLLLMKEEPRLMPHFHVSLQSPVSRVLRAMKREYRAEQVAAALEKIHSLNGEIFVGMDVIAGFPSESEEEHAETVRTLESLPWTRLHVFPYSEREGTPALKIKEPVPPHARKARAQRLIALSDRRHEDAAKKHVGRTVSAVLMESLHRAGDGTWAVMGHAPNYFRVMAHVPDEAAARGCLNKTATILITDALFRPHQHDWTLVGKLQQESP